MSKPHFTEHHPDRRDGGRLQFDIQVGIATEHRLFVGLSSNISAGGLFIATEEPLQKGDKLEVRFSIPGQQHVFAKRATVCWTRPIEADGGTRRSGAGVKLDDLTDDETKMLNAFLQVHDAIFYDL